MSFSLDYTTHFDYIYFVFDVCHAAVTTDVCAQFRILVTIRGVLNETIILTHACNPNLRLQESQWSSRVGTSIRFVLQLFK